eukprot:scaffold21168_cov35-Tisochrysis_lutea.AAC.9
MREFNECRVVADKLALGGSELADFVDGFIELDQQLAHGLTDLIVPANASRREPGCGDSVADVAEEPLGLVASAQLRQEVAAYGGDALV